MDLKRKASVDAGSSSSSSPKAKAQKVDSSPESSSDALGTLKTLMFLTPDEMGSTDAEFHAHFDNLASHLLNSVVMVINNTHEFRLTEIEFYLKGGKHQDIFTHCDPDQLTCGEWYFHKQGGKSYKGGSYKGLDITFGAKDKCHGGILIRAIQPADDLKAKLIEGPCMVVDNILKMAETEKILDLVGKKNYTHSVFSDDSILRLAPVKKKEVRPVVKSPRFGLTLKQVEKERTDFIVRDYRYLNVPEQMTKGKHHIIVALYKQGKTAEQICEITKTKMAVAKRYLELYDNNKHTAEFFSGKDINTELLCQMYSCLSKK